MNPIDQNLSLGTRHAGWPATLNGRFGRSTSGPSDIVRRGIERTRATLELWERRSRERRALLRLDDHLLRDIGTDRAQAQAEGQKPFWRA